MSYLIWSWEHHAWWRPNSRGYTTEMGEAGRYTQDEAADIVLPHIPPGEEVAVDERSALLHGPPPAYCDRECCRIGARARARSGGSYER